MTTRRGTILILEDAPARTQRFERVLQSIQPVVHSYIADTAAGMLELIDQHLDRAFAISLDHDLYPPGVRDAGDGMQVAEHLAGMKPACPIIIHTSNGEQGRRMHGVLDAGGWEVRLAGAIGEGWIETDWVHEVQKSYQIANA